MIISMVSFFIFLSSIIVITSFSPVTSVVYLIATFVITAIYLSSQNMVYIALTYIIVYVGAVITLFLFVIIIINLGTAASASTPFTQTIPLTIVIVILYTVLIVSSSSSVPEYSAIGSFFQTITQLLTGDAFINTSQSLSASIGDFSSLRGEITQFNGSLMTSLTASAAAPAINHWTQIQSIGFELYTHQAIWLVLVSIVLIISIIGPIVICRNEKI